jgi:nucleoside-diphosphate-sugar epimerase
MPSSNTPRIFITGANGLLGSVIVKSLLAEGYAISAIRRASSSMQLLGPAADAISWTEADLMDTETYREQVAQADVLIHAAAMVSFDKRDHAQMMDINVRGTAELVNLALEVGLKHFIQISSIAAIGRAKNADTIHENTKWVDSELNSQYAISKYQAELEVWRGGEEGLPFSIVNPSVVLGLGDLQQSSAKLFKYVWDQKPFYTDAIINYVDVEDVAEAVKILIEKGPQQDRFIISAGDVPYKTLFGLMAKHLGKRAPFIKANKAIVWAAVIAETLKGWVTGTRPLVTAETAKLSRKNFRYDNSKVQKQLGMNFKPLEETVVRLCTELKQQLESKN